MCKVCLGALFCLLLLCSCFGLDRSGGIMKYRAGTVKTGTGRFTVPSLPPPWKPPKIRLKQLVHENDSIDGTIVTDALCGPKFDDAPLPRLAKELFQRLQERKITSEKNLTLDGRAALRMQGGGRMDGVPIRMDVVVMKKDFCLYDFVYFAPPATYAQGVGDFEEYLHGFRTR